ncbi:LexA family protein [Phocaeicola paurosaccharolyticus]|jgi:DNA polymerase V|uniref:LexA family protein n=1 Tax=Phocaeicola paurosaccharolyticus TaxID=732242 RepID=UPI000469A9A3|nr:translesion error-prone DNA polymerase V autoproteolytic subunit [Phocaeicola paurosaccharolyticus]
MMNEVKLFSADFSQSLSIPFADAGIRAGFPSPAQDYLEESLDLNKELIDHPAATFYGKVIGNSMIDAGIEEGDILVIDKSLEAQNGDMVVGYLDGEFTLKYLDLSMKESGVVWLVPANKEYDRIKITKDNNFIIWGVVIYTIKKRVKRL